MSTILKTAQKAWRKNTMTSLDALREHLKMLADFKKKNGVGSSLLYCGNEDLVLQHGVEFERAAKRPRGVRLGPKKRCFGNCADLVMSNPDDFLYVEGFGLGIIPTMHAWVIDRSGNVYDLTWRNVEHAAYIGIPFKTNFLVKMLVQNGVYGILEDWKSDFPLLRGKIRIEEAKQDMDEWLGSKIASNFASNRA